MNNEERYREVLEAIRNSDPGYMWIKSVNHSLYADPVEDFIGLILDQGMTLEQAIKKTHYSIEFNETL